MDWNWTKSPILLIEQCLKVNFQNSIALGPILWWLCGFRLYKFDNILQMQYMKYILNMCLIHLQSIKMKNRMCFKYCLGICLMQYVWNMLNIILEVIETFHTHSPCATISAYCVHFGGRFCPQHTAWTSQLWTERFCQRFWHFPSCRGALVPMAHSRKHNSSLPLSCWPVARGPHGFGLSASLSFFFLFFLFFAK